MDRVQISALRRMPAVRAIAKAWRDRDSRRTLLACSGGADSSALVLALSAAISPKDRAGRLVVAHIVHDLRPQSEARADEDRARALAAFVEVDFVSTDVHPAHRAAGARRRNLEALARKARYAALIDLARASTCDAIATAHHANDQAETIMMRLLRGTGIQGLRAIEASRRMGESIPRGDDFVAPVRLIRPMLGVTRADAEAICRVAGWQWGIDHTNADTSRTRAWIRHEVLPMLEARAPGATRRLATMALHAASADEVLRTQAIELWGRARRFSEPSQLALSRPILRDAPDHLVSTALRKAIRRMSRGEGEDRVSAAQLHRAVAVVKDRVGGERQIRLGGASLRITRELVQISPAPARQE